MLKNLSLSIVSTIAIYLVTEFLFFPYLMIHLPFKQHVHLPSGFYSLAQKSKKSTVANNYIALVGDSYAQGFGDWLLDNSLNRNDPFHSAHVLYALTKRDVLSFGASGAGSLRGIVTEPITAYEYLQHFPLYQIDEPESIMVYFYEGNDLNNNLLDLKLRFYPTYEATKIYDQDYFDRFIQKTVIIDSPLGRLKEDLSITDQFVFFRFIKNIFCKKIDEESVAYTPQSQKLFSEGKVNRVIVEQVVRAIPDKLQGPALELSNGEIEDGVYVFSRSLAYLKRYFARAKVVVIYIPSPLASYELASDQVSIQTYEKRGEVYPASLVSQRSDYIAAKIEDTCRKQDVLFVDTRPVLRAASRNQFVHGPRDWSHFNRRGYELLGEVASTVVKKHSS